MIHIKELHSQCPTKKARGCVSASKQHIDQLGSQRFPVVRMLWILCNRIEKQVTVILCCVFLWILASLLDDFIHKLMDSSTRALQGVIDTLGLRILSCYQASQGGLRVVETKSG